MSCDNQVKKIVPNDVTVSSHCFSSFIFVIFFFLICVRFSSYFIHSYITVITYYHILSCTHGVKSSIINHLFCYNVLISLQTSFNSTDTYLYYYLYMFFYFSLSLSVDNIAVICFCYKELYFLLLMFFLLFFNLQKNKFMKMKYI